MATLQKRATFDKKVSIVIPTYDRPGLAEKLAQKIKMFHGNQFEVIVIKSTGNTSSAKNQGIKKTTGEIIVFFDDDVEITKDTIPFHIKAYEDSQVIGVSGRVINDGETIPKKTDAETGKTNFLATKFVYRFWSAKKQNVDFVYGCNMSFRKKVLQKIGGFDEKFPKIFEEVDLSKRIKKFGKILFEPRALVFHHKAKYGGIRPEERLNKQKLVFENYGRYLAKNVPFPSSLISLLLRSRTALKSSLFTLFELGKGYLNFFLSRKIIFLFLLLCLAVFTRFWKLGEFFTFNFDEEYQALLAFEQVKNFHPIWIGVSASNVNYYLGPGFTYLTALLLHITKDPIILTFFGSALGVVTALSVYYVTKKLFSQNAALYAFTFYTGSLFLNFFDRRYWSVTPLSFFCVWLLFFLYKIKTNPFWLIPAVFFMGLALHIHLSLLAFWPVVIYVFWIARKKINLTTLIGSLVGFIFVTLPLLIFDLNHNFDNMLMPVRFVRKFFAKHSNVNVINSFSQLLNTLSRIWFIKPFSNIQDEIQLGIHGDITKTIIVLSVFSFIVFIWLLYLSIAQSRYRILALSLMSLLGAYIFYPGGVVAYYLLGFLTLFTINIGLFLSNFPVRIGVLIIAIFIIINLYSLLTLKQEQFGLSTRKHLIQKIMSVLDDRSFYLETRTQDGRKYHSAGGWRYLFKAYGRTPSQSHADEFFGWIYQDEISKVKPKMRVIISEYPTKLPKKPIAQFQSGVYYGYVVSNETMEQ